jgi:hypothetical protein
VIRQLRPDVDELLVYDLDHERAADTGVRSVTLDEVSSAQVVVVATPVPHAPIVAELLGQGCSVVSTGDDLTDTRDLLELDHHAGVTGTRVVVGAAMAPGLSGLLARHLTDRLDHADEVHVAMHGTGGPSCAHQHHRALGGRAQGWRDGQWFERPGGSGRELCWFPDPIGARDCYRAELADPLLLQFVNPALQRISARMSGTRRDRLTARLPMLSPPHHEGGIGALRVEVRGWHDGQRACYIAGTSERAAVVAAAVASTMAHLLARAEQTHPDLPEGVLVCGSPVLPTRELLAEIVRRGIRLQEFLGAEEFTSW